jgi:hypothetical protein
MSHSNDTTQAADSPGRAPGAVMIGWAGWLLAVLGGGLLFVSFAGQYVYLLAARHQAAPSMVAALMFDAGMIVFSLLALGLARAGKSARTERAWIVACAAGSAAMNYAAADVHSPRSVAAFVVPPLFLAVVVDRVIAVVRRHVMGDVEVSPWSPAGRLALRLARAAGRAGLYGLRLALAPAETARGLRQAVLDAAPLPAAPAGELPRLLTRALVHFRTDAEVGDVPSIRDIRRRARCNQKDAGAMQAHLLALADAFAREAGDREEVA